MRNIAEKQAILRVQIPDRPLARRLLERWTRHSGVNLHILRGRITVEAAAYELEVRGPACDVDRLVRQSAPWDSARRFLHPAMMGRRA